MQPEVDERCVGVIGHSVGADAALLAASRRNDVVAAVSVAAFAHPAGMMKRWMQSKRIPFYPLGAYILFYVQRVIDHRFDDIAPSRTIRSVDCPVLIAHGTEDEIVPVSEARQIFANRRDGRVRLLLMPGNHNEYGELERYIATVTGFLDSAGRRTQKTAYEKRAPTATRSCA